MTSTTVTTAEELLRATADGTTEIVVKGELEGMPMLTLAPGVRLRGGTLRFGAKGVRLTCDNTLEEVTIVVPDDEVAVLNDTTVADFGTLALHHVRVRGQVMVVAEDAVRAGHVQIEGLQVEHADLRGRDRRPHGFGVEALQGAVTIWNRQSDPTVRISADLLDVSAGTAEEPVHGSGVLVGGVLAVGRLSTGEIHIDGRIPAGTPNLISGGVFVVSGAEVDTVHTAGPVTTYGPNDMVLDNWGRVDSWTVSAPITSEGPSGIGFVNFGDIDRLDVAAPLRTHGQGARGFNLYDGSLREARFASITTTGDGSIGIQVSKPMGRLRVDGDVSTSGGEGVSLVKGKQIVLKAVALSVKPGGSIEAVDIGGALITSGDGVVTLDVAGPIDAFDVRGGVHATGAGSEAVVASIDVPALAALGTQV